MAVLYAFAVFQWHKKGWLFQSEGRCACVEA